jgi:hypothetical protein
MPIFYNGKSLIPAPFISISKEYSRNEAGTLKKVVYVVTATGSLSSHKGSPDADGVFWTTTGYPADTPNLTISDINKRLAIFRNKIGAMNNLFCDQNRLFEIQPYDGSLAIKFVPRIRRVNFEDGPWTDQVRYSIEMETDRIDFGSFITCADEQNNEDNVDETWTLEPNDDKGRTYKLTHNLSSQYPDKYDPSGTGTVSQLGWLAAKDKVLARAGYNSYYVDNTEIADLDAFGRYNFVRVENIDTTGGKYALTETWILYDGGAYLEEYTVNIRTNSEDNSINVTIEGNVTGYSNTADPGFGNRWTNTEAGWAIVEPLLLTRAQAYSGVTLNALQVGKSVGKNPLGGVITYNHEYTNKSCPTLSGAISETVNINDQFPTVVIARHICVLRAFGPVLQDIGTKTESRRTLTIDVQMPAASGCPAVASSQPDDTTIITAYTPTVLGGGSGPWVERNETNFSPTTGRYNRTISWFWVDFV